MIEINKSNMILAALVICLGLLAVMVFSDDDDSQVAAKRVASTELAQESDSDPLPVPNFGSQPLEQQLADNVVAVESLTEESSLSEIKKLLLEERKAREKLQQKVASLSVQVNTLTQQLNDSSALTEAHREDRVSSTGPRNIPQRISGWIDNERLIAAGMSEAEADNITKLYESVEMEKLYLRDRAQREGWMASQRFRDEMDQLDERTRNLRNELGEQAYDALLYASGRPNRVIVDGTLGNSPAAQAGIRKGDAILKYAGQPIYSWAELRSATTEGSADEMVPVLVQRGNKRMEFYVKRGPLGIRLDQESINPVPQ